MNKKNIITVLIIFFSMSSNSTNLERLIIPEGFEISIFADKIESPRQLVETDAGYVIAGSKKGDKLYALQDLDFDGYAEKKILIADGLQNPTGVSFYQGNLYFAEIDTIWVVTNIDDWLNSGSEILPTKTVFMNDLPSETWHGFKYIDFGPDGNLYIHQKHRK